MRTSAHPTAGWLHAALNLLRLAAICRIGVGLGIGQTYDMSPTGGWDGTEIGKPDRFSIPKLQTEWFGDTEKTDITLVFLAGGPNDVYLLGPDSTSPYAQRLRIFSSPTPRPPNPPVPTRTVRLIGIPDPVTGRLPKLKMTPVPLQSTVADGYRSQWPPKGVILDTMISTVSANATPSGYSFEDRQYLKRIEIQNLELDGGFQDMGAVTSAANDVGYKSHALDLWADSGLIRNVVVRNFGSVGAVPWPLVEGSNAGTEAFPVYVWTRYRTPAPMTDNDRWIIEETTVTDFRSVHGGYASLIMPHVLIPAGQHAQQLTGYITPSQASLSPFVIVRRCTVQGAIGSAFGTAGIVFSATGNAYTSGRIQFIDNAVLNSNQVMNTDTGQVGPLTLNRTAALDIERFANMGTAGISSPDAWMRYYDFSENMVRIRGPSEGPSYRDFSITSLTAYGSNPALVLGRYVRTLANGLVIQGGMKDLRFRNNQFTTWPRDQYFRPDPGIADPLGLDYKFFRPIFVVPSGQFVNEQYFERSRDYAQDAEIGPGRHSSTPFDFTGPGVLMTGGTPPYNPPQSPGLSPTVLPNYTDKRPALESGVGAFSPRGAIRNVIRLPEYSHPNSVTTLLSSPPVALPSISLTGVREVAIGATSWSGNTLQVPVRVAGHSLPQGTPPAVTPGVTTPVVGAVVRLQVHVSRSSHANPIALAVVNSPVSTDGNGRTTIPVDLSAFLSSNPPNPNAHIRLVAWTDGAGSATAPFHADRVAWADHEVSAGAVVSLMASPDVGDDKNTASAKRAKLIFRRTGAVGSSLPVNFTLPSSFTSPHGEQLIASYGTTGSADYYLLATGGATLNPTTGVPTSVTIPAGESQAVVDIVTRADNVTEQDLVRVQLPNSSVNGYAIATRDPVDVLIYDGPEWSIYELYDGGAYPGQLSTAAAVNNGTFLASGAWDLRPQVVGTSTSTSAPGGGTATWAAWWSAGNPVPNNMYLVFTPTGISQRPAAGTPSAIVGNSGNDAVWVLDTGSGYTTLKHLNTGSPISAVNAISADGTVLVGRSRQGAVDRPVRWNGSSLAAVPTDLAAGNPANMAGTAFAVNDSTAVVGEFDFPVPNSSGFVRRAFRKPSASGGLEDGHYLSAPNDTATVVSKAAARAISSDSRAVGEFNFSGLVRRAVSWHPSVQAGSNPGRWEPVYAGSPPDVESAALGINGVGWIVGWSRRMDQSTRAVVRKSSIEDSTPPPWIDLNDPHAVYGLSGWNLVSAVGITDSGTVIGLGVKNGSARGYVLVRRISEN